MNTWAWIGMIGIIVFTLVLFFNHLNLIDRFLISNNIHSFESHMLHEDEYRLKVKQELN